MAQPALSINAVFRGDPTRTLTLRNRFVSDVNRRYRALKGDINRKIIKENFLAPVPHEGPPMPPRVIPFPALAVRYEYQRSAAKMDEFMEWLIEQEEAGILEITGGPGITGQAPWTNTYIQSTYQSGMIKARNDLRAAGADIPNFNEVPGGISAVFNQPFHADRVGLAYSRTFNGMRGITAQMNTQLSHELALGMSQGLNPKEIARNINDRIDKIGATRARLIARTEVVQSHNEAALNEFENAENIIGEEVLVQWWSALDSRVRYSHDIHTGRHGRVYTREEGRPLLGEPNCRCALIPYIPSIQERPTLPRVVGVDDPMGAIGGLSKCVITGSRRPSAYIGLKRGDIPSACNDFVRDGNKWFLQGKEVVGDELDRLNAMKLPPGWQQVTAATDKTARIQAIGLDKAGRWQYRYSADHVKAAAMKKFNRVKLFSKDMPSIRKAIKAGIREGDSRAFLLELENKTAIRAGSLTDFRAKKKAYGLTTLQHEHVTIRGNKIVLDFVAKEGIPVRYELEDRVLAVWLEERKTATSIGDRLFPDIPANKLNKYLKDLAGGKNYTIKDFRTYHGTRIAFEELQPYIGQTLTVKEKKTIIKRVSERVSGFLKNTPIMARNSYIDPMVWDIIGGL